MNGQLDHLDRRVIASLDDRVGRQWNLRQTHCAGIGVFAGTEDLERRHNGQAHVQGTAVRPIGSEAHVDVKKGCGVALEPSWLECERTACRRPICPVLCNAHTAACDRNVSQTHSIEGKRQLLTWIHPLHAIGKCVVGDQVVSSPSGICDDGVC